MHFNRLKPCMEKPEEESSEAREEATQAETKATCSREWHRSNQPKSTAKLIGIENSDQSVVDDENNGWLIVVKYSRGRM